MKNSIRGLLVLAMPATLAVAQVAMADLVHKWEPGATQTYTVAIIQGEGRDVVTKVGGMVAVKVVSVEKDGSAGIQIAGTDKRTISVVLSDHGKLAKRPAGESPASILATLFVLPPKMVEYKSAVSASATDYGIEGTVLVSVERLEDGREQVFSHISPQSGPSYELVTTYPSEGGLPTRAEMNRPGADGKPRRTVFIADEAPK